MACADMNAKIWHRGFVERPFEGRSYLALRKSAASICLMSPYISITLDLGVKIRTLPCIELKNI